MRDRQLENLTANNCCQLYDVVSSSLQDFGRGTCRSTRSSTVCGDSRAWADEPAGSALYMEKMAQNEGVLYVVVVRFRTVYGRMRSSNLRSAEHFRWLRGKWQSLMLVISTLSLEKTGIWFLFFLLASSPSWYSTVRSVRCFDEHINPPPLFFSRPEPPEGPDIVLHRYIHIESDRLTADMYPAGACSLTTYAGSRRWENIGHNVHAQLWKISIFLPIMEFWNDNATSTVYNCTPYPQADDTAEQNIQK